ncbi:uncharacterized protein LOC117180678 [Belonocnema kinseyi]|uniref:uncharacterized protein LOC117180678 n=1 Tax=Belonocnema kinseyi TaxID=2817044 RepID=UPI00143DA8E3|nr:uncharacterized protein LOC117180678 [Belonocnema kinseyi]
MWSQFCLRGNYECKDILPALISKYNNTKHRSIGMKQKYVAAENGLERMQSFKKLWNILKKRLKFKVDFRVRVNKHKQVFEKGYTLNCMTETCTIDQIMLMNAVTYTLKDYKDQPIASRFYEQELLRVTTS